MGGIYAFKNFVILKRIADIRIELGKLDADDSERLNDLLSEQIILERIKMTLSNKLGRTITV